MADGARIIYRVFSAVNNGARSTRVAAKITNSGCRRRPRWSIRKLNSILLLCSHGAENWKKNYLAVRTHTHSRINSGASLQRTLFYQFDTGAEHTTRAVSLGHYFSCAPRRRKQYNSLAPSAGTNFAHVFINFELHFDKWRMSYGLSALLCIFIRNFLHITIIKIYDTEGIALARKIVCFFAPWALLIYVCVERERVSERETSSPPAWSARILAAASGAFSLDVKISFRWQIYLFSVGSGVQTHSRALKCRSTLLVNVLVRRVGTCKKIYRQFHFKAARRW